SSVPARCFPKAAAPFALAPCRTWFLPPPARGRGPESRPTRFLPLTPNCCSPAPPAAHSFPGSRESLGNSAPVHSARDRKRSAVPFPETYPQPPPPRLAVHQDCSAGPAPIHPANSRPAVSAPLRSLCLLFR